MKKIHFMILGVLVLGAIGIVALSQLKVQEKTTEATSPKQAEGEGVWIKRCQDIEVEGKKTGEYCEAMQQLFLTQKEGEQDVTQRLAEMAFGYAKGAEEDLQGVLVLPLGILVQRDVEMLIDGENFLTAPVVYCDNGGCYVTIGVNKTAFKKLKNGNEISIHSQAANGLPLQINFSLSGLSAVIDALK